MQSERTDVGTIEDLHTSATRLTGLDDFGDDAYREGMATLLSAYRKEAALTLAIAIPQLATTNDGNGQPAHKDVPLGTVRHSATLRVVNEHHKCE